MKSHIMKSPAGVLLAIFTLLTLLMLATRTHHFSAFNQLPSASVAIFFLAGMYLRSVKAFWFFYLLSIAIDLSSSYFRGQLSSCLTASYPMLVFSYAAMFGAGYLARPNWSRQQLIFNIAKIALTLFVASSIAFFISNGSYYALSGKFGELSWSEYAGRVDKYYLKSISNPIFYVVTAMIIDWSVTKFLMAKPATVNQRDGSY